MFDPANRWLYVGTVALPTSTSSPSVEIFTGACGLVGAVTLPTGAYPDAGAFDLQDNDVYFADYSLDQVYVITGTTLVATLSSPTSDLDNPSGVAYDPGDSLILVTDTGGATALPPVYASNVTAISGTTIVGTIAVGPAPFGIAYDPVSNAIVVANGRSANVTILSATFPFSAPHINVGVGYGPADVVFDPATGLDYVINNNAFSNVTLLNGRGYTVGSITLTGCSEAEYGAWDQASLEVYVACGGLGPNVRGGIVDLLNSTSVVERFLPPGSSRAAAIFGMDYDAVTHRIFLGDWSDLRLIAGPPAAPTLSGSPGVKSCAVGTDPWDPAFDPVTNAIYVPNFGSANISVVVAPCQVVATVALPSGAEPIAAAFDPSNNFVYVADQNLNEVYVLNNTTLIATLASGWFSSPDAVAFDPGDGVMLVANSGSDNLTVLSGTSLAGWIGVGFAPAGIAFDPYYSTLLVTNLNGANVTVIESAIAPIGSSELGVGAGSGPEGIAFNPVVDADLVANEGSANVTIFGGLGTNYGSQPEPTGPTSVTWSQGSLDLFVTNYLSHSVWVLGGSNWVPVHKFVLGSSSYPIGAAYNGANGDVYVTELGTGILGVLA